MATGVLVLLTGRATRLARFLGAGSKVYEAAIRLGVATDTYDGTGRRVRWTSPDETGADARLPADVDRAVLDEALAGFRGTFRQSPPPFSAKKVEGVRAYRLARRRTPVEPPPVMVTVESLELLGFDGTRVDLRLVTTPGFYVRSLAHDLGVRLRCGAHLEALRRTQTGGFGVEEATPLEVVEAEGLEAAARLIPMADLLPDLPGVVLTERGARRAAHGNAVLPADVAGRIGHPGAEAAPGLRPVRLLDRAGALVAIAEPAAGPVLHPVVVLV
jgi:tRNA pseudouridine55 synthase